MVLGAVVEAGEDVIELDGAKPDVGDELEVDAGPEGGGERMHGVGLDGKLAAGRGYMFCSGYDAAWQSSPRSRPEPLIE